MFFDDWVGPFSWRTTMETVDDVLKNCMTIKSWWVLDAFSGYSGYTLQIGQASGSIEHSTGAD